MTLAKTAGWKDLASSYGASLKKVAPHAAVGGVLGAGIGASEAYGNTDSLKNKVQKLEGREDLGLGGTMNLAQARARLSLAEYAKKHPAAAIGMGALGGAFTGAQSGPGLVSALKEEGDLIRSSVGHLKKIFGKGAA